MPAIGDLNAVKERRGWNFTHADGWQSWVEYKGQEPQINGLVLPLAGQGYTVATSNEGAFSSLRATRGTPDEYDSTSEWFDRFTIRRLTIEKDLFTLPAVHEDAARAPFNGDLAEYRKSIQDVMDTGDETLFGPNVELNWPVLWAVYHEICRGVQGYEVGTVVLSRERMGPVKFFSRPTLPDQNTTYIYTTNQIKAEFQIPDFINVTWPVAGDVTRANTQWGWRTTRNELRFIEGNKIEQTYEWTWAEWSTWLYNVFA